MLRIRRERLSRGWSLTHVSGLTGIATSDLSLIERGLQPVFPGWRQRLARAFRVPGEQLFAHDIDDRPGPNKPTILEGRS